MAEKDLTEIGTSKYVESEESYIILYLDGHPKYIEMYTTDLSNCSASILILAMVHFIP